MTMTAGNGWRLAACGVAAAGAIVLTATMAAAQRPPSQQNILDRSDLQKSRQDQNLKGQPVPPTVTPLDKVPVDRIKLPAGFKAEVWAHGMPGARTIVQGPKGTYFIGTRQIGRVYAVTDNGGQRQIRTIIQGLNLPNGLVVRDGSLYVFAINRVLRYDGIEDRLDSVPQPVEMTDRFFLPTEAQHGWKYVAFGPDGKLYVPIGANCNICEVNPAVHSHIRRYDPKDWSYEIVARGVRNTVGFDWHPVTKELWFTDNGRDWAGDDGPQDELNRVPKDKIGGHFGYPYCHAQGIPDPDIKVPTPCGNVITAAALMGPHAAALGMKFYTGGMFPGSLQEYRDHRPSRLLEPLGEIRLRRRDRASRRDRKGEDRAIPDRARRREGEPVVRPPRRHLPDEGRLDPRLRRLQWRDLSDQLRSAGGCRQEEVTIPARGSCRRLRPNHAQ